MRKAHAFAISSVLALCAVTGAVAAMKTVHLGAAVAAPARAAPSVVASRRAKLDRWSASLRRARASRPPRLPSVPRFAPVPMPVAPVPASVPVVRKAAPRPAATPAPAATAAAAPPAVTYVQPPPVIQYQQAPSTTPGPSGESDDEGELDDSGHDGGGDDGGDDG